MQQKQKIRQKSHHELASWLNTQSSQKLRSVRIFIGVVSAILAYPMIVLALWFFQEITLKTLETGTSFNLIEWLAPLGFVVAPVAAILGALFIGRGRKKNVFAARMLLLAVIAGVIGIVTTTVYTLFLGEGDYFASVGEAITSLLEFGRIGVGPVGVSLPATLLIAILAIVFTSGNDKRK